MPLTTAVQDGGSAEAATIEPTASPVTAPATMAPLTL